MDLLRSVGGDYRADRGASTDGAAPAPAYGRFMAVGATGAKVADAMRVVVVSCPPDTPLREVAGIMATFRIHCVVVAYTPEGTARRRP